MKITTIILLIFITMTSYSQELLYAVAKEPTPVLNTPDFVGVFGGVEGISVKTDDQGLIREMEYVALPGTVFSLLGEFDHGTYKIYKVEISEYKYNTELYVDSRFLELYEKKPPPRKCVLPSMEEIYKYLDNAVGASYIWGGNCIKGIDKLLELYKPKGDITDKTKTCWSLKGVDCSGLMYEATNGWTERNTSKLVNFGEPVEIEGLSAEEIKTKLKPFDMMVWNGHVIYVYDENTAIQSGLSKGGVVKTDLLETLQKLIKERTPVNDYNAYTGDRFVVRRWYPESN
ncbi:MAG TPA: peptidoglycan endopeptidase [Ignavibacteria bacterium]|jgi:hypothetical protein